ncbi:hypothetical protein NQ317_014105 [Molorchus minor]|uniref:Uncharacterized protein n=1 Tax=Molorchus minor TaxID=1323400 RepID=A0ABQ9IUA1_9CUCU|nr:hypothetical protein NQ317_014105 [Molorchus minor]
MTVDSSCDNFMVLSKSWNYRNIALLENIPSESIFEKHYIRLECDWQTGLSLMYIAMYMYL